MCSSILAWPAVVTSCQYCHQVKGQAYSFVAWADANLQASYLTLTRFCLAPALCIVMVSLQVCWPCGQPI